MRKKSVQTTVFGVATVLLLASPGLASEHLINDQRAATVDALIVFAADNSMSVDSEKNDLMRHGHAAALNNTDVLKKIRAGPLGRIAVLYVEWASHRDQRIVVDWTVIDGYESARQFAAGLKETPRSFNKAGTAIGAAVAHAIAHIKRAPFKAERHVIDVVGDGTANDERALTDARNDAVKNGIVVNGLAILSKEPSRWPWHTNPPGGLENYYRNRVIAGTGAFVVVAKDYQSFVQALTLKLSMEIASGASRALARY